MCVLGGVLFFEIECKGMQTITQGDTQTLIKLNNCNKTGDLDIFQYLLSRRVQQRVF